MHVSGATVPLSTSGKGPFSTFYQGLTAQVSLFAILTLFFFACSLGLSLTTFKQTLKEINCLKLTDLVNLQREALRKALLALVLFYDRQRREKKKLGFFKGSV